MKLSWPPRKDQYPHWDVEPVVKELVQRFGPDRLMYGGGFDSGSTSESYLAYREWVCSNLNALSEEDQRKVLGGTAARVFGFGGD